MALDQEAFSILGQSMGFSSMACYAVRDHSAALILSTKGRPGAEGLQVRGGDLNQKPKKGRVTPKKLRTWPVVMSLDFSDYILNCLPKGSILPIGWVSPSELNGNSKSWPRDCFAYFPEQELRHAKIFFVVHRFKASKKRHIPALDGRLDAVAMRIAQWTDGGSLRHFVNEDAFHEHLRQLNLDLQLLLDHEMRNPLTVVQGYASMLAEGNFKANECQAMYEAIDDATKRALKAIDKLSLTMSTEFDRNSHMLETAPVELSSLAQRVFSDINAEVRVPGGMKVELHAWKEKIYIRGIRHLLHRAIYEVMLNAVMHSRAGSIVVRSMTMDKFACLEVEDNGRGIPSASAHLIFQRFYQDPKSLKEKVGTRGLGLGLYLARHIVEEHGGQLLLIPRVGGSGSTFRFIWPISVFNADDGSHRLKQSA